MKHTASKIFRALCGMAVMLALVASITSVPVLAASNGIYLAAAAPHYKHPVTGKIEDSGGESSAVLGQSMTESATYNKALVEVDANGSTYVTIRLKLMDNIQNLEFQVDGSPASATPMQEDYDNNTADFRMKVNSENSVIRCSMYVVPMGRQVIFYITVSDLQAGSGDFITSIKVNADSAAEPAASPAQSQPSGTEQAGGSDAPSGETAAPEVPETKEQEEAAGLQEFDASGGKVEEDQAEENHSSGGNAALLWTFGGVAVVAAGLAVWYFCFFKKKK